MLKNWEFHRTLYEPSESKAASETSRKRTSQPRARMQEHILQTGEQVRRFYAKGGAARRGAR
ncbi:MAG TPA: hypothetical protein VG591_05935 [Burkholderiales bacterium]|nr:hypothetical protein [Burkholderiales bacterium]